MVPALSLDPAFPRPSAHTVLEALAYATAFALYRLLRKRRGDELRDGRRWTVVAAAAVGAALGSRVLHHLASPSRWPRIAEHPELLASGKTVVGALLGGWAAVELAKRLAGEPRRTGDLFALPLVVGIAIGRVGCFLAGLNDDTHGASLADGPLGDLWPAALAVEFGDGVERYPVRLLEIALLVPVGLLVAPRRPLAFLRPEGARFRFFLAAYLAIRLALDFLKPYERVAGLGVLQWACLAGLAAIALTWRATDASAKPIPDAPHEEEREEPEPA